MRIDIIVTRDDGSTITIGCNQRVSTDALGEKPGARLWNMAPNFSGIRSLTKDEAWAASFLCAQISMRHLPIDPGNVNHLRAAVAFSEPSDRERGEEEEAGRIAARQRFKPGESAKPYEATLHCNDNGDAQIAKLRD